LFAPWHSVQAIGAPSVAPVRCDWCAPTARALVSLSPCVPTGGAGLFAARCASPWQKVHSVCQPACPLVAWHALHETPTSPPLRSEPWQVLQLAKSRFAA
jgi:hypothetical protein